MFYEAEAKQEMNNTLKKGFATMKYTCTLAFANELIHECMKLKAYGQFDHEINKAYIWLMIKESRATFFLVKHEELRKYWVELLISKAQLRLFVY